MEKLPEICLTKVLSLTSPKDACRLSLVDATFCRAAEFDQVWEQFLPIDYKSLISQAANPPDADELKTFKQLYFWLCDNPLIIDQGTKSFSLEKQSGKRCYMLAARDLDMTPTYTSDFSKLVPERSSRFGEVAEVFGVKLIKIRGKMSTNLLSENTTYTAFLVYKQKEVDYKRRNLSYKRKCLSEGQGMSPNFSLRVPLESNEDNNTEIRYEIIGSPSPRKREDGWWEVKFRDYYNGSGADAKNDDLNLEVEMCLLEQTKLIVQGIEIRPKEI